MGMKSFKPYTPSRRNMTVSTFEEVTKKTPEKSLLATKKKNAGRNANDFLLHICPLPLCFKIQQPAT